MRLLNGKLEWGPLIFHFIYKDLFLGSLTVPSDTHIKMVLPLYTKVFLSID